MYSYPRAVLYAIVLWGVTFLAAFLFYPVRVENPMLFGILRVLGMALLSVALTVMYFRDVEEHLVRDGIRLGAIWLAAGVILDQALFVWGLMQLSFMNYLTDTGLTYLICPIITVGAGLLLSADKNTVEDSETPGKRVEPVTPSLPWLKDRSPDEAPGPKNHP